LQRLMPPNLLPEAPLALDLPVLAFTFAVAIVTGLLFGLLPALIASNPRLAEALKEGGRGLSSARGRRFRQVFVTAQVAVAVVVLIGAGLLVRSFEMLVSENVGFDTRSLLTARVALSGAVYGEPGKAQAFFEQFISNVKSLPGVTAVTGNVFAPFTGPGPGTSFEIVGRPAPPGQAPVTDVRIVTAGYFATLGIPVKDGRDFAPEEFAQRRDVVVINETLARRHFPGRNPVGEKLVINLRSPNVPSTIVGVVGDIRHQKLDTPAREMAYWPHSELPLQSMTLLIRTQRSPEQMMPTLQRALWALDRNLPLAEPRTMEQLMAGTIVRARFAALLFSLFAGLALVLAALGIYGVISYKVALETRDIGVRMAIGASRAQVLGGVIGGGSRLALLGVVVGVAAALSLSRLLASQLYEVSGRDPLTFVAVPILLLTVAIAACLPAAIRAASVDPMNALRDE
jgi:putative ABC transport system permease protein